MGTAGCYGCGGVPVPVAVPAITPIPTGFRSPIIDADPITPGIQARPGVVTPVGPPRFAGGVGPTGGPIGRPIGGPIGVGYGGPGYPGAIGGYPGAFTPAVSTVRF